MIFFDQFTGPAESHFVVNRSGPVGRDFSSFLSGARCAARDGKRDESEDGDPFVIPHPGHGPEGSATAVTPRPSVIV